MPSFRRYISTVLGTFVPIIYASAGVASLSGSTMEFAKQLSNGWGSRSITASKTPLLGSMFPFLLDHLDCLGPYFMPCGSRNFRNTDRHNS